MMDFYQKPQSARLYLCTITIKTNFMETNNHELAYLLLRVTLGVNFFLHGFIRIYNGVSGFKEWMIKNFEGTLLTSGLVSPFASILPYLEALLGLLLLTGLLTRLSLTTGFLLMICLISGLCIKQDWHTVGIQMIYVIFFFILIWNLQFNRYSLDKLFSIR
ncbi:DoxX family membrane protein [Cytophagaceae bacterium DM2B3-1]|uniref:DoxX family membrane protein n=1 Tax=Xanthocytophaga flava TaxID=3048013 RepID=A0ABT7CTL6_9BACT|nr:DoxX family membrane protein [Xanthocytophaga flavus]MDJ1497089.1 DoxX family membrane protein [Xanthocytophaga flavus]